MTGLNVPFVRLLLLMLRVPRLRRLPRREARNHLVERDVAQHRARAFRSLTVLDRLREADGRIGFEPPTQRRQSRIGLRDRSASWNSAQRATPIRTASASVGRSPTRNGVSPIIASSLAWRLATALRPKSRKVSR